jgi:hypothetical protein
MALKLLRQQLPVKLIPFTTRISEERQDKDLGMKLREEEPGILNRLPEGLPGGSGNSQGTGGDSQRHGRGAFGSVHAGEREGVVGTVPEVHYMSQ